MYRTAQGGSRKNERQNQEDLDNSIDSIERPDDMDSMERPSKQAPSLHTTFPFHRADPKPKQQPYEVYKN